MVLVMGGSSLSDLSKDVDDFRCGLAMEYMDLIIGALYDDNPFTLTRVATLVMEYEEKLNGNGL